MGTNEQGVSVDTSYVRLVSDIGKGFSVSDVSESRNLRGRGLTAAWALASSLKSRMELLLLGSQHP